MTAELEAFLADLDMFYLGTTNAEGQPKAFIFLMDYARSRPASRGIIRQFKVCSQDRSRYDKTQERNVRGHKGEERRSTSKELRGEWDAVGVAN